MLIKAFILIFTVCPIGTKGWQLPSCEDYVYGRPLASEVACIAEAGRRRVLAGPSWRFSFVCPEVTVDTATGGAGS